MECQTYRSPRFEFINRFVVFSSVGDVRRIQIDRPGGFSTDSSASPLETRMASGNFTPVRRHPSTDFTHLFVRKVIGTISDGLVVTAITQALQMECANSLVQVACSEVNFFLAVLSQFNMKHCQ